MTLFFVDASDPCVAFDSEILSGYVDGDLIAWVKAGDLRHRAVLPDGCDVAATAAMAGGGLQIVVARMTPATRSLFAQYQMQTRLHDTPQRRAERFWSLVRILAVPAAVLARQIPTPPPRVEPEPEARKALAPKIPLEETPSKTRTYTRRS